MSSSSNQKTRWGVVSAGLISWDFANALTSPQFAENHAVVAVAARSAEKAAEFAKSFDITKSYGTYEQLAADAEVEVVYVGSINPTHLDLCKMMLNAGKHVLCEKPLAMNVKETKEILALAKEKGLFLMEAMWARLQPSYLRLKEELDKGTIGRVYTSHVSFGQEIKAKRISEKELGGGTILDLGVYTVFFSQLVFNGERPKKIVASGHLNEEGTDESVGAVLTYSDGRTATIVTHSKVVTDCEAVVYGTGGSLKLAFPFWCSQKLTTPAGVVDFTLPGGHRHKFNFWNSAGLAFEAEHVRECLGKGLLESPKVSQAETLLVAEIMEEIRKQVGVHYPQDD